MLASCKSFAIGSVLYIVYADDITHNFILPTKNTPEGVFLLFAGWAACKLGKFNDKTILRKCDTSTNIDRIDHTDIELVAVVWLNVEVVTIFLEAIADTWVEDSDILLGGIAVPEWILGRQGAAARGGATDGHPWAAKKDSDIDVNTEDLPKVFDYETYCNMLKEFWEQIIKENALTSYDENALKVNGNAFKNIDLLLTETNYAYIYEDGMCKKKADAEGGFSPITKCPKYLGFRIEDEETRLYLYIGTLNENGEFVFDESYHIDTTGTKNTVNYLRQSHNRFIETDGEKYFYYKIAEGNKVTLIGCDEFPESESDIIATANVVVKNNGDLRTTTQKYYSVVLPSGCFYAVLTKQGMPTFLKDDIEDDELTTKPIFNVSYQTGVQVVDGEEMPIIEVNRGASFGYIPENVGAALLRLPHTYNLSDLCIYTDKAVKSNAKSGRRRKAKEIGGKVIKDFTFESQKEIFWNDSTRPMTIGRRFYGVPYSSRWVNSHYLGFEVTPETVVNALNDPYSVAYDGGFVDEEVRAKTVSGHTEISTSGGTGYGLVCSAFTNLICGNPYPQSNRGYTFDSNYVIENTVDMNSGEVLANKGLSHCVFVDEIYDEGYSLYEAVDPCVAKTTHTCSPDVITLKYASSKVRTNYLDDYVFSVTNKDTSGYESLKPLLNFENFTIPNGKVRPWRGNKAVYGSWDITQKVNGRDFGGSGIGVTLRDGITSFTLRNPSGIIETIDNVKCSQCFKNENYADISAYVTENGTYEISDGTVSEYFRFYNHDTVQLTFDTEGKAVFKTLDGKVSDDVEYIYVNVKGYGGAFGKDASLDQEGSGAMVIAKGKCYPDLALDTSRILDIRAAIVSDPAEACWGKYSVATSPDVVSEYKGGSLRVDIEKLKNSIGETTYNKDITDTLDKTKGMYSKSNGVFLPTAPNSQGSQLFEVKAGEKYFVTGCYGYTAALIVAFDKNNTYIADKSVFSEESANITAEDYEYIVPEGVAYIGCSTRLTIAGDVTRGRDLIVKKEGTELDNAIAQSDIVTEFLGTDEEYEGNRIYNANAVNQAFAMFGEVLEAYEERISVLESK